MQLLKNTLPLVSSSYLFFLSNKILLKGITYITEALKLSEALAAVTLLALANGAGDVITAIVAGSAPGAAGISYDVGALYGAGFFVCAVKL